MFILEAECIARWQQIEFEPRSRFAPAFYTNDALDTGATHPNIHTPSRTKVSKDTLASHGVLPELGMVIALYHLSWDAR